MYLEFQRLGNMGKYEDHETDGWNLTAKIKTSCSRRVYHGSSISVLFVMVLTFCCFALNVKWAFAASSSSPSHVSAGVISSEYNNRLDESLQQLHQHNDVRPQEDESFLLNEVDDDVQWNCLHRPPTSSPRDERERLEMNRVGYSARILGAYTDFLSSRQIPISLVCCSSQ
ncbi:hypothetical protein Fcan01_05807 [Folsomia candida]|uniref:Uncharacterized protein n=1 Tax=Folsomia candida TaxID=158441 RepID=A0A226ESH4_FOLCA|nr:hypothetical protein Fcan01_05807 [Folsomia candida]